MANDDAGSRFDDLQEMVLKDARKVYSEKTIQLFLEPQNYGPMEDADAFGTVTGGCGDTMSIWLRVSGGVIEDATFTTSGCGSSIASASMATILAKGRRVEEAAMIDQNDIFFALDGLPDESAHCASLAAQALRAALEDLQR